MKNNTDKLEHMSMIDTKYVEDAAYPAAQQKENSFYSNKWWKVAVSAAAVLALSLTCLRFYPQIKAFAGDFFNSATVFDDGNRFEGQMAMVPINEVSVSDLQKEYYTLNEVEELLGVNLLQSPLASSTLYPCIHIEGWLDGGIVDISSLAYYLHNCSTTPRHPDDVGNPVYTHADADDAYHISYDAEFLCNGKYNGDQHHYDNAQLVEKYTTSNGLHAAIFYCVKSYNAVIYHNNIRYEFEMNAYRGSGDVNELKAFLDTLSD